MDVAQKLDYDKGTNDEGMVTCLAFVVVFGKVAKRFLTTRMAYYQLAVNTGASFVAQMATSVETPMMEVESAEFSKATKEYQKAMAHEVVSMAAKGEQLGP